MWASKLKVCSLTAWPRCLLNFLDSRTHVTTKSGRLWAFTRISKTPPYMGPERYQVMYLYRGTHSQSDDAIYRVLLWDYLALLSRLDCPFRDLSVCSLLLPLQVVLSDCSSNPDLQEQENDPGEFVQSCEHGDCRHSFMSGNKEYIRDEHFCNLSNAMEMQSSLDLSQEIYIII